MDVIGVLKSSKVLSKLAMRKYSVFSCWMPLYG